jgi:hypothetical protein
MDIDGHIDALRADLGATAGLGDDATMRIAEQLSRALAPAFRLRLQDMLAEAALELNDQLPSGHVELRLSGNDVGLAYAEADRGSDVVADEAQAARVTLRLPEHLKARAESAAAGDGVSLNTWLVRSIARALDHGRTARPGQRLTGYASS